SRWTSRRTRVICHKRRHERVESLHLGGLKIAGKHQARDLPFTHREGIVHHVGLRHLVWEEPPCVGGLGVERCLNVNTHFGRSVLRFYRSAFDIGGARPAGHTHLITALRPAILARWTKYRVSCSPPG